MPSKEPSQEHDSEAHPEAANIKSKFRAALERKQSHARDGNAHKDAMPKNNISHGPAAHKRDFRRKTG